MWKILDLLKFNKFEKQEMNNATKKQIYYLILDCFTFTELFSNV